jgi:quercetin dioxygenase-like cupin family protein
LGCAWHSHEKGQYLRVTQGVGRFGSRDGQIIEVHPGQTLHTPPGEEHWHATAPGVYMEHVAMFENGDNPTTTTTWLEQITDDDYHGNEAPNSAGTTPNPSTTTPST